MSLGEDPANGAVAALESVEAVDAAALKLAGAVTRPFPSVRHGTRYPAPGSAMRSIRR